MTIELICHVLNYLTAHELVRARQICRTIKTAIDHSELLQYTIDLGFFRMTEIPSDRRRVPVATRRKELREFESSWRNLRYRRRCDFPLLTSGPVYEFVGGIYALARENGLHFSVLPHNPHSESKPTRTWHHPVDMTTMVDFTFCPSQDLLVIVMASNDHHHCHDLHLRSLRTNSPHPHAVQPILKSIDEGSTTEFFHGAGPVKIQVLGKYTAILCREVFANDNDMGDYLQLWSWMTDKVAKFTIRFPETMNDFVFLSEDSLLLVADDGSIEIYSFLDGQASITPRHTARLSMPNLMKDWQPADAFIGGRPTLPIGMTAEYPRPWAENELSLPMFHPTLDDQLLAFHVTLFRTTNENDMHSFVFFMFRTELLRLQTLYEQHFGSQQDPEGPFLPYSIWGKHRTQWFPDSYVDWQNSVYGYRTVELVTESKMFPTEPRRLLVRDFNPSLLFFKPPLKVVAEEMGGEEEYRSEERGISISAVGSPGSGLSIHSGVTRPFAEPLGKGLPHREVISKESFNAAEVMMDEGRILLFSRREGKDLLRVEILIM
ncbi:hypothetical protein J3A83DRAFT_1128178 [Scleroderma citrinum]